MSEAHTNLLEVSPMGDLYRLTSAEYHRSTTLQVLGRRENGVRNEHDGKMIIHRVLCYLETEWFFKEHGKSDDRWYGRGYSFIQVVLGLHGIRHTREQACRALDAAYGIQINHRETF
jgi:hypothetical protein